jgi:FkbM family methyltransferase
MTKAGRIAARTVEIAASLLWRIPIRGKGRLADTIWRPCLETIAHAEVSIPGGARLSLDLRDRVQRQMLVGGYERDVVALLRRVLRPGSVFFDVGAHIGLYSILGAKLVERHGFVHCFEPDSDLFQRLMANIRLNNVSNVAANQCAVSSYEGSGSFHRSTVVGESGWGSLGENAQSGTTVNVCSLDSYCQTRGIVDVHWLKIDAEGSELEIIRGANHLLRTARPSIIIEINGPLLNQHGLAPSSVLTALKALGYRISPVQGTRPPSLSKSALENVVFLPDG